MKNYLPARVALASLLIGSLLSCQKQIDVAPSTPVPGRILTHDIIANYSFDWENTGQMPVSASSPAVNMPWSSQGGQYLDPGIVSDYHKIDGWDMVYDSFSPDNFPTAGTKGVVATSTQQPAGGLYFALYNRLRGILRYYLYIPPGLYGTSTQVTHGLSIYTDNNSTSKLLNFNGNDITDPTTSSSGFTSTAKEGIPINGGWVAFQYQIAYDPTSTNATYPHLGLAWNSHNVSITAINLNGQEEGNLHGTITTPAPSFSWLTDGIPGIAEVLGTSFLGTKESSTGIAKNFASAASGGLAGTAVNILSGLFGGNSGNSQTVDLTISSTIATTGTAVSGQPFSPNSFLYPTQTSTNQYDPLPLINYPIGLFNLSGRPKVTYHVDPSDYSLGNSTPAYATFDLATDVRAALLQLNPSVFNTTSTGASITDFKTEVVVINPGSSWSASSATQETIGTRTAYTGPYTVVLQAPVKRTPPLNATLVYVRVSFHVKPNTATSSAANPFIVKTFVADIVPN